VLGIPHPPGTPLFVMLGHVWGHVFPIGAYAWRLNLMSACFSAAGAGCFFLVAHRLLVGDEPRWRIGGAAAAAVLAAFTFTVWQNSNETEVYTLATFSIAAVCWLCIRWRDLRGTTQAPHCLLLILYIAALSIGNHLLALLVGPAVSVFIFVTLRAAPAADPGERRVEWAEWATVSALWVVLMAVGLGSTGLLIGAGLLLVAALAVSVLYARSYAFPAVAVLVAVVGVSTYGFLYVRSGLQPILDEADPETWRNLLAVIRREQYGIRTPFDNPLFDHGPENPGRTLKLFGQQLANFGQYFTWQWGRTLPLISALVVSLFFVVLGTLGFVAARQRDPGIASLLGALWLVTGLGLVVYMNFKPGFSMFWDQYTTIAQHEVRERDYFFTVSFQVWGLVAGIGLAQAVRLAQRARLWAQGAAVAVALLPFALNFHAASRRHGPDATIAADFAYNLLQSVEPYGVLFTFGDNDTFPVWYLQEVEGVRQDVTLINLSLANLDWYVKQLVVKPTRPFDPARAPAVYRSLAPPAPPGPVLPLTPTAAGQLEVFRVGENSLFQAGGRGGLQLPIRAGQILMPRDQVILFAMSASLPKRPVTFGISSGRGSWLGLDPHLALQGLAYVVVPGRADTVRRFVPGIQGPFVDGPRTAYLADSVFRYGDLLGADTLALDPAATQITTTYSVLYLELANAAGRRSDAQDALAYLRRAYHFNPSPTLADLVRRAETQGVEAIFRP
jgi:hypothetical protein